MITMTDPLGPDERLDMILDKIIKTGIKKLEKKEIEFLESFSKGREIECNEKLSEEECRTTFISDDGNFTFVLYSTEIMEDVKVINGKMIVPELKYKNRVIPGELLGSIIVFSDNNIAIDFKNGRYDIFEFVWGLEYELDCFVDDIVINIFDIIK